MRADKHPIDAKAALALVRKQRRLIVAKGKKTIDLAITRNAPSDDELRSLIIGPSGNLRAPAIRVGDTLIVGFTVEGLRTVLGTTG